MTYSVSATGTKEDVLNAIEQSVTPAHPEHAQAFVAIVNDLKGDRVSITANGYDTSCSLSLSSWTSGEAQGS